MWIADNWKDYELIDASNGERLERWGQHILVRPDPQVIWKTPRISPVWKRPEGRYSRSHTGGGSWDKGGLPASRSECPSSPGERSYPTSRRPCGCGCSAPPGASRRERCAAFSR